MKLPIFLLTVLLLGNGVLVFWPRAERSGAELAGSEQVKASAATGPERGGKAEGARLARALRADGDAAELRDALRAIGLKEDLVVALVKARLFERANRARSAFWTAHMSKDWWRVGRSETQWGSKETEEAWTKLSRGLEDEFDRVLGPEHDDGLTEELGYVEVGKRRTLSRISEDYYALRDRITREMNFLALPEDRERLRLLDEEHAKDLAELLSPAERAEHDLRREESTRQLTWNLEVMEPTEAEFRTIAEIRAEFEQRHVLRDVWGNEVAQNLTAEQQAARKEDERAMQERLRAALGEERYRDYLRAQEWGFREVEGAAERFERPPETARQVFALREETSQAVARVVEDKTMTNEQKRAALARMGEETRAKTQALLGEKAYQVLTTRGQFDWVEGVARGDVYTYSENGYDVRRGELQK